MLTASELAALGGTTSTESDDWGFGEENQTVTMVTPRAPTFTPDVAAVLPPDAPKNDANAPAPAKVKRGAKKEATPATSEMALTTRPVTSNPISDFVSATIAPKPTLIEFGPEAKALLLSLIKALEAAKGN